MEAYEYRYFISVDTEDYIDGMFISFSEEDEASINEKNLIEIDKSSYESVGPDMKYVGGKIYQGEPRIVDLTPDAWLSIRESKISYATKRISTLNDATDPEIVSDIDDADISLLKKWKQYRVALTKMDLNDPAWPIMPE